MNCPYPLDCSWSCAGLRLQFKGGGHGIQCIGHDLTSSQQNNFLLICGIGVWCGISKVPAQMRCISACAFYCTLEVLWRPPWKGIYDPGAAEKKTPGRCTDPLSRILVPMDRNQNLQSLLLSLRSAQKEVWKRLCCSTICLCTMGKFCGRSFQWANDRPTGNRKPSLFF